jgi:putative restriction endonuclease
LVCVGPKAADNRWLREAFENRVPIIYFLGVAPGRYQAMLLTFICGWDDKALKACVAFWAPDQETLAPPETALERRATPVRAVKQRLHRALFREARHHRLQRSTRPVARLPEPLLLDAAHIVSDKDERLGQSAVTAKAAAAASLSRHLYGRHRLPQPRMWQKSHKAHQIHGGHALTD